MLSVVKGKKLILTKALPIEIPIRRVAEDISNKKRNSSINQNDNAIFVAVIVLLLARIDNAILKTLWKNAFLAGLTQKTKAKNFHCGFASFEN